MAARRGGTFINWEGLASARGQGHGTTSPQLSSHDELLSWLVAPQEEQLATVLERKLNLSAVVNMAV